MQIYKMIEKQPGWKKIVAKIDSNEKWFTVLVNEARTFIWLRICAVMIFILFQMDAGLGAGGMEDRNSLKYDRLCYARPNSFDPHIPFRDDKSAYRSFNHVEIAELLCPIYHLPEFTEDRHGYVVISNGPNMI